MINKSYSLNTLAVILASEDFTGEIVEFGKYEFNNASVEVKGHMKGYFNIQRQTYEDPPFCDLKDVYIEIRDVRVDTDDYQKIFTQHEKEKLEEMIKHLMIGELLRYRKINNGQLHPI